MATGIAGSVARDYNKQLTHYLRKTVNFNDAGVITGVLVGTLPAGAEILRTTVKIKVAFNAVTTNVLTVGTNASTFNNIVAGGDVAPGAVASTNVPTGAAATFAADSTVNATYTQTGTAATTGRAIIIVEYAVNNDL